MDFGQGEPVKCDDIVFNSVKECANYLKVSDNALIQYLKGATFAPKRLKNKGLRYLNKETCLKFKKDSDYHKFYFFSCDGQSFKNITELCNYLNCPKSSIYNHLYNQEKNIFIYKGKEIMWKVDDYNS